MKIYCSIELYIAAFRFVGDIELDMYMCKSKHSGNLGELLFKAHYLIYLI